MMPSARLIQYCTYRSSCTSGCTRSACYFWIRHTETIIVIMFGSRIYLDSWLLVTLKNTHITSACRVYIRLPNNLLSRSVSRNVSCTNHNSAFIRMAARRCYATNAISTSSFSHFIWWQILNVFSKLTTTRRYIVHRVFAYIAVVAISRIEWSHICIPVEMSWSIFSIMF